MPFALRDAFHGVRRFDDFRRHVGRSDPAGPPLEVRHRACGGPVDAVVRCRHDHEELTARQTESLAGPGARPAAHD